MTIQCTRASEPVGPALQPKDIRRQIHQLVERHSALTHGWKLPTVSRPWAPVSGRVFDATRPTRGGCCGRILGDRRALQQLVSGQARTARRGTLRAQSQLRFVGKSGCLFSSDFTPSPGAHIAAWQRCRHGSNQISNDRQSLHSVGDDQLSSKSALPLTNYSRARRGGDHSASPRYHGDPYTAARFAAARIAKIVRRHNLLLIEDCCDALGVTPKGRM